MKYFGTFDPKTLELSDIEIENLMLDYGLLEKKLIGTATNIENNILKFTVSNTIHIKPSKELVEEYYKFIIDLYSSEILEIKLPFFKIFNDEIYGLDPKEQKKIALDYFKQIYNTIYKDVITIYNQRISSDGIVHTHNFNKLKMLHYQLEAYKINLSDTRSTLCYLTGDRKTYIDSNFIENKTVAEVLKFEAWKQIIVELNSRYGFEDDYYFNNKFKDDINFLKHKKIFKTLESYQFTNTKIKSFKDDEKAKSVSLYQAIIDLNLITDNKAEFKKFMKTEYDFSPSEIVTYEKDENRTHDKRVAQFKDDWKLFDVQK
jgi:hypothetical protein